LSAFEEGRTAAREAEDRQADGTCLGNMGNVYHSQGKFDLALKAHQDALTIDREIGYRVGEANDLCNMGIVYRSQGKFDLAHHPRTMSYVLHTRHWAAARQATYTWTEYMEDGIQPPDVIGRGHAHRYSVGCHGDTFCVYVPPWQLTTSFGFRKVRLPHRGEQLYLLVVKGLAQEPLMVLTDLPLRRSRKVLWWMVRAYFRRWAIEETIRFIKQSYQLEDVRVLTYRSLQNLMPLVLAAAYFAAVVLDTGAKLTVMTGCVLKAAKRLFGIPDFRYYAIADGLRNLFRRHPGTPKTPPMRPDPQLRLFEPLPP